MKITKYEHACVVIEEAGKKLVIDPGEFTTSFGPLDDIVAVVITHQHTDHLGMAHVQAIVAANPGVQIFAPADVYQQHATLPAVTVTGGDAKQVAPFALQFYGQQHATIHPAYPVCQNVGVLVNQVFYYPGDSFTAPGVPVAVLALPVSAPWLKISESLDLLQAVKPMLCFPTHNALLSEFGQNVANAWVQKICDTDGITLAPLQPGQDITI